jgi:aminoglycoside phosphotransferase (APT) family kinase protein
VPGHREQRPARINRQNVAEAADARVVTQLPELVAHRPGTEEHDLNLSNILTDGAQITGVVDWDEFGLGSRALDLVALALDCERAGEHAAADRLRVRPARSEE